MDVVNNLKKSVHVLGFRENTSATGHTQYVTFAYLVTQFVMVVNFLYLLAHKWEDIDGRILVLKTIVILLTFTSYSLAFTFYWDECYSILVLYQNMQFHTPFKCSIQRKNVFESLELVMRKINKTCWALIVPYTLILITIPIAIVLVKIFIFSGNLQDIIEQKFTTPFPLYFPKYFEKFNTSQPMWRVVVYTTGYVAHTYFSIITMFYVHLTFVSPLCALANVECELKQLSLSLTEMDLILNEYSNGVNGSLRSIKDSLKIFLRYFIHHHQYCNRKLVKVRKGIRWMALTAFTAIPILICLAVYSIAQNNEFTVKLQETIFLAAAASTLLLFSLHGEKVKTQAEEVSSGLYGCDWVNKPEWFKRSLLIAITVSNKPIEINPFGLCEFSFNKFLTTVKAAYCYYNFLSEFKSE